MTGATEERGAERERLSSSPETCDPWGHGPGIGLPVHRWPFDIPVSFNKRDLQSGENSVLQAWHNDETSLLHLKLLFYRVGARKHI